MASRKKGPSAFEVARTKLLDSLLELFKVYLVTPCSLPLNEVCYFNHVSSLRKVGRTKGQVKEFIILLLFCSSP